MYAPPTQVARKLNAQTKIDLQQYKRSIISGAKRKEMAIFQFYEFYFYRGTVLITLGRYERIQKV